jgi:hypothetical protein
VVLDDERNHMDDHREEQRHPPLDYMQLMGVVMGSLNDYHHLQKEKKDSLFFLLNLFYLASHSSVYQKLTEVYHELLLHNNLKLEEYSDENNEKNNSIP